jgi:hypothetical protein
MIFPKRYRHDAPLVPRPTNLIIQVASTLQTAAHCRPSGADVYVRFEECCSANPMSGSSTQQSADWKIGIFPIGHSKG